MKKRTFRKDISEGNEIKTKAIKLQLFNNSRWERVTKFFGSDARKQTPDLEIQTCFHLQLLALDYTLSKYSSWLNKLLLLMWPRL